jgi:hypothetical protein
MPFSGSKRENYWPNTGIALAHITAAATGALSILPVLARRLQNRLQ